MDHCMSSARSVQRESDTVGEETEGKKDVVGKK